MIGEIGGSMEPSGVLCAAVRNSKPAWASSPANCPQRPPHGHAGAISAEPTLPRSQMRIMRSAASCSRSPAVIGETMADCSGKKINRKRIIADEKVWETPPFSGSMERLRHLVSL